MSNDPEPKTLYHYCSTSAFCSIIQGKNIRLSNLRLSNDATEGLALLNSIKALAEKQKLTAEDRLRIKQRAQILCEIRHYYGISFSEHDDSLSQWRAYADDGRGVAIGFSAAFLKSLKYISGNSNEGARGFKTKLLKMEYYDKEVYSELFEETLQHLRKNPDVDDDPEWLALQETVHLSNTPVPIREYNIKNQFFKEEAEWRLLTTHDPHSELLTALKTRPASTGEAVIPYFEVPLKKQVQGSGGEKICCDYETPPIVEVLLGPKHTTPKSVVENMLHSNGFPTANVRPSKGTSIYR